MLLKLLLLFVFVPLAELALLLYLADVFSWQHTLLLVIATGVVGTLLARSQGWRTWVRIRDELAAGQMPAESLLDAVLIFVAGALLLTPGVLTDALGISLLIPWCRHHYRRRMVAWFKSRFTIRTAGTGAWNSPPPPLRSHRLVCRRPAGEGRHRITARRFFPSWAERRFTPAPAAGRRSRRSVEARGPAARIHSPPRVPSTSHCLRVWESAALIGLQARKPANEFGRPLLAAVGPRRFDRRVR